MEENHSSIHRISNFSQCGWLSAQILLDLLHCSWVPVPTLLCVLLLMAWSSYCHLRKPALGPWEPFLCRFRKARALGRLHALPLLLLAKADWGKSMKPPLPNHPLPSTLTTFTPELPPESGRELALA